MSMKGRAKELVDIFYNDIISQYEESEDSYDNAKQCALICVKRMIKLSHRLEFEYLEDLSNVYGVEEYLHKLLEEVEKL